MLLHYRLLEKCFNNVALKVRKYVYLFLKNAEYLIENSLEYFIENCIYKTNNLIFLKYDKIIEYESLPFE